MQTPYYFGYISLWGFFFLTIFVCFLVIEAGYRLGISSAKRPLQKRSIPIESLIGAKLGLLAFILAFTFNLALNHFDARRQTVLEEANAIGTTYLRAGYLVEPYQSTIRKLLKEYVALRLSIVSRTDLQPALKQNEIIQNKLWDQILQLVDAGYKTPVESLAIQSLNEVIDLHAKRLLLVFGMTIPGEIWIVLVFVLLSSMAILGYISGLKGSRSILVNYSLAVTFACVLFLIVDLDYPREGYISVSQQPLIDLLRGMAP